MIDILQKILAFAVTLGVLVVFHELGHYVVARLAGVKVLRFSVGFGRIVWSRRVRRRPDRVGAVGGAAGRLRQDGRRARRRRRAGRPAARVQPSKRLETHRDRRRGADRQPAAGGAALRRHVRGRHSRPARAARAAAGGLAGGTGRIHRRRPGHRGRRASPCARGRTCAGACSRRRARDDVSSRSSARRRTRVATHAARCRRSTIERLGRQFHVGAGPQDRSRRARSCARLSRASPPPTRAFAPATPSSPSTAQPMRSPSDVAAITNAHPGDRARIHAASRWCRHSRAT